MKITYDSQANATYVYLNYVKGQKVAVTKQINKCYVDFAEDGSIIGIEYLNAPLIEIDGAEVKLR
jgi:uncharacterized protein YuzE